MFILAIPSMNTVQLQKTAYICVSVPAYVCVCVCMCLQTPVICMLNEHSGFHLFAVVDGFFDCQKNSFIYSVKIIF